MNKKYFAVKVFKQFIKGGGGGGGGSSSSSLKKSMISA
jgi:hypothetical protein